MIELISRQSLLNKYDAEHIGPPGRARRLIEEEPTVEERKTGKAIVKSTGYKGYWACDQCGAEIKCTDNFCRHCGAKLEGAEECQR